MKKKWSISIIIAYYNRYSLLSITFQRILDAISICKDYNINCFIINDGSNENQRIPKKWKEYSINLRQENSICRNSLYCRNWAIENLYDDFLLHMDADFYLINLDSIYKICESIDKNLYEAYDKFYINRGSEYLTEYKDIEKIIKILNNEIKPSICQREDMSFNKKAYNMIHGGYVVSKKLFKEIGGYNYDYGKYHGYEDVNIYYRLIRAAKKQEIIDDWFTIHLPHPRERDLNLIQAVPEDLRKLAINMNSNINQNINKIHFKKKNILLFNDFIYENIYNPFYMKNNEQFNFYNYSYFDFLNIENKIKSQFVDQFDINEYNIDVEIFKKILKNKKIDLIWCSNIQIAYAFINTDLKDLYKFSFCNIDSNFLFCNKIDILNDLKIYSNIYNYLYNNDEYKNSYKTEIGINFKYFSINPIRNDPINIGIINLNDNNISDNIFSNKKQKIIKINKKQLINFTLNELSNFYKNIDILLYYNDNNNNKYKYILESMACGNIIFSNLENNEYNYINNIYDYEKNIDTINNNIQNIKMEIFEYTYKNYQYKKNIYNWIKFFELLI